MSTIMTERDVLNVNAATMNVAITDARTETPIWRQVLESEPDDFDYLITAGLITLRQRCAAPASVVDQPKTVVSPAWLGRVKKRLTDLTQLPPNWDSYGAAPVDPRVVKIAEGLIEWFAIDDMPPLDLFATSDGGVQLEWHLRRVNAEINISLSDGTSIYFQDLKAGDPWTRPASSADLQTVRRRLLERP